MINRKLLFGLIFFSAFSIGAGKISGNKCKSWKALSNDYDLVSGCFKSYLLEYEQKYKSSRFKNGQRYDLPVISSFPAQRMIG